MIPGGKSGPFLVAVSASDIPLKISTFPANLNFTPGPYIAVAHRPYIMVVPVQSAAACTQTKGTTWNSAQDALFSGAPV